MKKLVVSVALVVFLFGYAFAKDDATESLGQLGKAANCTEPTSPWRPWCIATEWSKGKTDAPKGTLVGISVELPADKTNVQSYKTALSKKVGLVAFAVTGDQVKLIDVKATEKGEEMVMMEAVAALSALFKGRAKSAPLKAGLAGYVKGLKGTYKATKGADELTWQGANAGRLRKVGRFWVAIETSKAGTVWVSILTDAWQ